MIPVRQILNSSYFPDDFDDENYDNGDDFIHYYVPIKKLPEFFIELCRHWLIELKDNLWFWLTNTYTNSSIDADFISLTLSSNVLEFKYKFKEQMFKKKDILTDNSYELKSSAEEAIQRWIKDFSKAKDSVCYPLANLLIMYETDPTYDDFVNVAANCLDVSSQELKDDLNTMRNTLKTKSMTPGARQQRLVDKVARYLSKTCSTSDAWMALIYTSKFTNFKIDDYIGHS